MTPCHCPTCVAQEALLRQQQLIHIVHTWPRFLPFPFTTVKGA